jgi:predicted DNA-binding protein with PD1-like motif
MTAERRLKHPGPALSPRVEIVAGEGEVFTLTLEAGLTLHDAIARPLLAKGITSAALSFGPARLDPLVYYTPAIVVPGPTPRFGYSEGVKPPGGGRLDGAFASFGRRDGEPFVHCHAAWQEADGHRHGGHVVPPEAVLAAPVEARVAVLPAARLVSESDAETEYTLFHPVPSGAPEPQSGARMVFARVKPNEDLVGAVESTCREAGFARATVRGLGSLIGARFADGTGFDDPASEVFITRSRVDPDADGVPRAEIDVCFAGFDSLAADGRLLRGENPVCITFELLIEEGSGPGA